MTLVAYRAALLHALADPTRAPAGEAAAYHEDGLLVVDGGHVAAFGAYEEIAPTLARDTPIIALPGRLITPGFVDAHTHYPQVDVMAAWGSQLLDWLNNHTFPAELAFADRAHADQAAAFFLDQLLRNGTTSALVFCTVHKASVDALFEAALARGMRLVAGKVLMDRHAPDGLRDTVESGRADSEALIRAWRGRGRLGYAVTPRFAVTSSDAQLAMAGDLAAAHPDVLIHTHLSENLDEIDRVAELFPGASDYLDVYARHGLVTDRSVFAHCVHASDDSLRQACACGVNVGLGTDVGAGSSFFLPHMMGEAYKIGQLAGETVDPLHAFYMATLAGARALKLDDRIGNLLPGKEADFLVLDLAATPLLARRMAGARTLSDKLFALSLLADDRVVERTYLAGRLAHDRARIAA